MYLNLNKHKFDRKNLQNLNKLTFYTSGNMMTWQKTK